MTDKNCIFPTFYVLVKTEVVLIKMNYHLSLIHI